VEGFLWELNTNTGVGHCWRGVVHALGRETSSLNATGATAKYQRQPGETLWVQRIKATKVNGRADSFKTVFSASFQD